MLANFEGIKAVEFKTRSLTPLEVMLKLEKDLSPYLVGCDFSALNSELKKKLADLKKIADKKSTMLFFLGSIQSERLPEHIMVQDGVVKWLIQEGVLKTYPSELPYVNWSAKILNGLPKDTVRVGIKDSGSQLEKKISKNKNVINLIFPGSLIPGVGQVDAMMYLYQSL